MKQPNRPDSKTILVAGIDTVRHKNLHQFRSLEKHGYKFIILTTDLLGDSADVLGETSNVCLVTTKYGFKGVLFLMALLRILLTNRIDIAEIYPYSFGTMLATAMIKLFRIPTASVARGEEFYYLDGKMTPSMEFAFEKTYKLVDHVIYKELYATDFLDKMGKDSRFLLSNAVNVPDQQHTQNSQSCTFLFLNSMKHFRHPETPLKAFLEICAERKLGSDSPYQLQLVGFQGEGAPEEIAKKEAEINEIMKGVDAPVQLIPWTSDSASRLNDADIFLLPADVVYLNYSLLEAMARNLVPMVQDAPGAELILDDRKEGFILQNDVSAWKKAMESAMDDYSMRCEMGAAARKKVESDFSIEAYERKYCSIYETILNPISQSKKNQ